MLKKSLAHIQNFLGLTGKRHILYIESPATTTAAPLYFKPLTVTDDDQRYRRPTRRETNSNHQRPHSTYIDGRFREQNNPAKEAYYEVLSSNKNIGTFVSVGTGRKNADRFQAGVINRIKAAFDVMGDTERTHDFMGGRSQSEHFPYCIFASMNPRFLLIWTAMTGSRKGMVPSR